MKYEHYEDWGINFVFMKKGKQQTLLQFWTTRYVLTLCIGLVVIGIISTLWLRSTVTEKRLDIMKLLAEEIADRVVDTEGQLRINPELQGLLDKRLRFLHSDIKPFIFVLDENKRVSFSIPEHYPGNQFQGKTFPIEDDDEIAKTTFKHGEHFYVVKRKINYNQATIGWVVLLHPEKDITRNRVEHQFLFIMLGSLAILGWGVIYLFTRKLSEPIKNVADAAKQIVAGNYNIELQDNCKEKEISELIRSFKDMAERLRQLEQMRTELLAGVTHELKTPVTSISGLTQAVKDEIVTGDEAKEFLEICSRETSRLQKMIEDLLDFNAFAVGEIKVKRETQNINQLIQEISNQWMTVQEEASILIDLEFPEYVIFAETDALRVHQILYNLLNNAKHAMGENKSGKVEVVLYKKDKQVWIEVKDYGIGIPEEEQSLIFERFFRGQDKRHRYRGLGLGLSYSNMMAKALGGDLVLKESSSSGTTFILSLDL